MRLCSMRPQTIALVLSYVDAEKSAAVIEELDDERVR